MDETHKIPKGAKVRLKPECAGVYNLAAPGAEAWARRRRMDPIGDFPQIFVEWDKDHWAYNGEDNIWTFEEHFELIEDEGDMDDAGEHKSLKQRLEEILEEVEAEKERRAAAARGAERAKEVKAEDTDSKVDSPEELQEILGEAYEDAKKAKAVIVVTIHSETVPGVGGEVLIPHVYGSTTTTAAGLLLEAQVSQMAFDMHHAAIQDLLEEELGGRHRLGDMGDLPDQD